MTDKIEIDGMFPRFDAEKVFCQLKVGRRANGKKFGESLNEP